MKHRFSAFLFLAAIALPGCVASATFQPASAQAFPPKPASCALDVLTLPPQRPFVEVGTFDIEAADGDRVDTTARLVELVRPQACGAGADGIVGAKNGLGMYVQATAFRWADAPPPAPAPTPPNPAAQSSLQGLTAPAAPTAPATATNAAPPSALQGLVAPAAPVEPKPVRP
jgi:hypothetical protein